MSTVASPVVLDRTGVRIAEALENRKSKVASLDGTSLAIGTVVEAVGAPVYVDDVSKYESFGITETGWYIFARITAKNGITVTAATSVEGAAGYIAAIGSDYVDVAVRFEVAAVSQMIVIDWGGFAETFVFKATDLAVRNLDYRVTFYVYDVDDFATWEYALTTDRTFGTDRGYYILEAGEYKEAEAATGEAVPAYFLASYALTADTTFAAGKVYYTEAGGVYTEATVTVGEAIPADTYYERSYTQVTGSFESGVTYYELRPTYVVAEVTVGAEIPDGYYTFDGEAYVSATGTFEEGVTYYTKSAEAYVVAEVTVGAEIPAYYSHSKVTFEGMTRNITYVCNTPIDCPVTFILPEIEDETHGAWFEIRFKHLGAYSSTLVVPEGVKVATEHTQAETAGINMVDLHYTVAGDTKIWRFMNTHSSIPA